MKKRQRGNALLEYVVPMALLILAAGFVSTVVDIKSILAEYFMSGSGYTSSTIHRQSVRLGMVVKICLQ